MARGGSRAGGGAGSIDGAAFEGVASPRNASFLL